MTTTPISTPCPFCGYFHAPDYSDVRGTVQEWIEYSCKAAQRYRAPTGELRGKQPKPDVAVVARTPDGRTHKWLTTEEGEHRPMPLVLHVKFKRVHGHAGTPVQAYRGDAGWDLECCEEVQLLKDVRGRIRTGIVAAIPDGYWGLILPRSSTWRNRNIHVEPAVIDSGYRGPIAAYGIYLGPEDFQVVRVGDKLIQILVIPMPNVEWVEQMDLPTGERGERGYGSSGA